MTAEVAVMNKLAVALAADSAVTFSGPDSQKFYSGMKLFTLSKHRPVGVMVYGNAELHGVPWETIIKIYRRRLGNQARPHLQEYFADFVSFLQNSDDLFPAEQQEVHVRAQCRSYLTMMKNEIDKKVKGELKAGPITDDRVATVVRQVIEEHFRAWESLSFADGMTDSVQEQVGKQYANTFSEAIETVFQRLPIDGELRRQLNTLAAALFCRVRFPRGISGVVIAGFGEDDHFPVLRSATIQARVAGYLKYQVNHDIAVGPDMGASIVPFAQSDVVDLFIQGVDPTIAQLVSGYLQETFREFPARIVATLQQFGAEEKAGFSKRWETAGAELLRVFEERLRVYIDDENVQPMLSVVEALPKEELASLAEALVNLTSLKRRVSLEAETVGGPIDVAVVSKGDGFVWIRRKHYFRPELNHHFFANYYERKDETESPA